MFLYKYLYIELSWEQTKQVILYGRQAAASWVVLTLPIKNNVCVNICIIHFDPSRHCANMSQIRFIPSLRPIH